MVIQWHRKLNKLFYLPWRDEPPIHEKTINSFKLACDFTGIQASLWSQHRWGASVLLLPKRNNGLVPDAEKEDYGKHRGATT